MASSEIKIMIVDGHPIYIESIKLVLRKLQNIKIEAHVASIKQAMEVLSKKEIDIVITDVKIQRCPFTELIRLIKKYYPNIKVLVTSSLNDKEIVKEIINAKADGYILKNAGKHVLIGAINKIAEGGVYYSETMGLK